MHYKVKGVQVKPREFPKTHHRAGFKDYYNKARIFVRIIDGTVDGRAVTDKDVIRDMQLAGDKPLLQQGLESLELSVDTKCVWSSKQEAFVIQTDLKSKDTYIFMEEIKNEESSAAGVGA